MPDIPALSVPTQSQPHSASTSDLPSLEANRASTPPTTFEDLGQDFINTVSSQLPLKDHLSLARTSHAIHTYTKNTTLQTKLDETAEQVSDLLSTEVNSLFHIPSQETPVYFLGVIKPKIDQLPDHLQNKVYEKLLTKRREASLSLPNADSPTEKNFRAQIDGILSHPERLTALRAALSAEASAGLFLESGSGERP